MLEKQKHSFNTRPIYNVFILLIIAIMVFDVVMPERFHYSYEGEVVKVEQLDEGCQHKYKYTYIDKDTKKTMVYVQDISNENDSYTYRNNNERFYIYRWYTQPGTVIMVGFLVLFILFMKRPFKTI